MEINTRQMIATTKAPAAIGPYAQANRAGNLIFTSGQIPLDPQSGEVIGATAAEQTKQVLENLASVLEAAGSSLSAVVKTTVFLQNISDFSQMNEMYAQYFKGEVLPSRSTIEVSALPKGVLVEIEAIGMVL